MNKSKLPRKEFITVKEVNVRLENLEYALKCFVRDELNQGEEKDWELENYTVVLLIGNTVYGKQITVCPNKKL